MRNVFALEPGTQILADDPYIDSYPYLLEYFSGIRTNEPGDFVRGAHMVYGWMPTILGLYPDLGNKSLDFAAKVLTKARCGQELEAPELESLSSLVNNSLVGASKLLHFAAPATYPIWDSRVYSFVHEKRPHHYRVNNVAAYASYLSTLKELRSQPEFPSFHKSVVAKLGYEVTPMRSLELVMFLNAPVYGA